MNPNNYTLVNTLVNSTACQYATVVYVDGGGETGV